MQVVIKLETIGDFQTLVNTLLEKQHMLENCMKTVSHKSTDEDIKRWVKWNNEHCNLQSTIEQLKEALKS